jgi:hypothetical protein
MKSCEDISRRLGLRTPLNATVCPGFPRLEEHSDELKYLTSICRAEHPFSWKPQIGDDVIRVYEHIEKFLQARFTEAMDIVKVYNVIEFRFGLAEMKASAEYALETHLATFTLPNGNKVHRKLSLMSSFGKGGVAEGLEEFASFPSVFRSGGFFSLEEFYRTIAYATDIIALDEAKSIIKKHYEKVKYTC